MHSIESSLNALGFSREESKIYLTCLESGSLPVSVISRNTKVGRINCYHYIEKLIEKGFLLSEKKSGVKHFMAENPKVIINTQQEKINIAHRILPEMLAMASSNPQKPKIQFFEGIAGVQKLFQKFLEFPNAEVVSFSNFKSLSYLPEKFLKTHFEKRMKKNIKSRFITPNSPESQSFQKKFLRNNMTIMEKDLVETFFISPDECNFSSEISVFSGNIAIFSLSGKNPEISQGVLIENPEIFKTQKSIFDLAWLGATSFVT
ncbi:TPA: hypothetical protein EYP45_03765 [Candidatus Peregrinibacteria bacterium]|nr:hypothetical protein [Candidatus Peregrinibacteria bacterium]